MSVGYFAGCALRLACSAALSARVPVPLVSTPLPHLMAGKKWYCCLLVPVRLAYLRAEYLPPPRSRRDRRARRFWHARSEKTKWKAGAYSVVAAELPTVSCLL